MKLTDEQWAFIEPIIPLEERQTKRRGRPFVSARCILNGVFWVLKTGARWRDLPKDYPSNTTCHRRFKRWCELGVIKKILEQLALHLKKFKANDLIETYIDASFIEAKKGAQRLENPRLAKGLKSWQLSTFKYSALLTG